MKSIKKTDQFKLLLYISGISRNFVNDLGLLKGIRTVYYKSQIMILKILLFISLFSMATICLGQLIQTQSKEQALEALTQNISDVNRQHLYNYLGKFYLPS